MTAEDSTAGRSLPAFILGLLGGIIGLFGGFFMTGCSAIVLGNTGFFTSLIATIIGPICGLVGAARCLKGKTLMSGAVIELVVGIVIAIYAYAGRQGAEFLTIFAMICFVAGGIAGIITALVSKKK